jgi:hypothetical protein
MRLIQASGATDKSKPHLVQAVGWCDTCRAKTWSKPEAA